VLLVEIDGIGINGAASAFQIRTDNTVIKGLVINRFTNSAISIEPGEGHPGPEGGVHHENLWASMRRPS